jgi:hypothetical protein
VPRQGFEPCWCPCTPQLLPDDGAWSGRVWDSGWFATNGQVICKCSVGTAQLSGCVTVFVDQPANDVNAFDAAANRQRSHRVVGAGAGISKPMPRCGRPVL